MFCVKIDQAIVFTGLHGINSGRMDLSYIQQLLLSFNKCHLTVLQDPATADINVHRHLPVLDREQLIHTTSIINLLHNVEIFAYFW